MFDQDEIETGIKRSIIVIVLLSNASVSFDNLLTQISLGDFFKYLSSRLDSSVNFELTLLF